MIYEWSINHFKQTKIETDIEEANKDRLSDLRPVLIEAKKDIKKRLDDQAPPKVKP